MKEIIKRSLFRDISGHLSAKEITMIVGARQVGKTTLMNDFFRQVVQSDEKALFLNLDIEADARFFVSQEVLLERLRLEFGDSKGHVFVDEIQRKTDAGLFLKGIYDLNTPYKFIVSGSGSLELKEKIHESLAGRKRLFEMTPVTFSEFSDFKTQYKYTDRLDDFFRIDPVASQSLLSEYLMFGGYPRVVLALNRGEKNKVIHEIFRSYAEKDIAYFLKVDRVDSFELLLKLLAAQTGKILSYANLCKDANISFPTLKKYLWYAEKTFAIHFARPYFRNNYKEIVKAPVAYFSDLGLRNALLGIFGNVQPHEFGFVFQNYVMNALLERNQWSGNRIKFWRTTTGKEIDFIIDTGTEVTPVEVKYATLTSTNIEKSLRVFLEEYEPKEALVVNLTLDAERIFGKTKVKFIPFWKL
jgi:predicted AAA+ superfamily ATPase